MVTVPIVVQDELERLRSVSVAKSYKVLDGSVGVSVGRSRGCRQTAAQKRATRLLTAARRRAAKVAELNSGKSDSAIRREKRWERRAVIARLADYEVNVMHSGDQRDYARVPFGRTAGCGRLLVDEAVEIKARFAADGRPSVYASGVQTCGSVWMCPVCEVKIRRARSADVATAAQLHESRGYKTGMLTLTIRHGVGDSLAKLIGVLKGAWKSFQQSERYRELRRRCSGFIAAMEITQGLAAADGSWHPHMHILFFCNSGDLAWFNERMELLREGWCERVARRCGGVRPDSQIGFHWKEMPAGCAEYIASIAKEIAHSDLKGVDRSPWAIVDAIADGELWAVRAWYEWCRATKGKASVQWSRGLRDHFGMGDEATDDEIVALPIAAGVVLETRQGSDWARLCHTTKFGEVPAALRVLQDWEWCIAQGLCESPALTWERWIGLGLARIDSQVEPTGTPEVPLVNGEIPHTQLPLWEECVDIGDERQAGIVVPGRFWTPKELVRD